MNTVKPLKGRSAIVTGASQGLGYEIARHYILAGANVLVCAREGAALERGVAGLKSVTAADQIVEWEVADVSQVGDTQRLVQTALRTFGDLHILVNNAGVYGPKGPLEDIEWTDWVKAIEINLLGSALMCRAVLPHFKSRRYGKIVQLSGGGATNPLPCISAYAASKAAIVRLSETVAEEVRAFGVDVNSMAPGALNTRLLEEILEAGTSKVGAEFYARSVKQKQEGGTPTSKGAELAVFLASAASDGITGKLLSAVWDPWTSLHEHIEELRKTDVYTLRRIVPRDRGLAWDN